MIRNLLIPVGAAAGAATTATRTTIVPFVALGMSPYFSSYPFLQSHTGSTNTELGFASQGFALNENVGLYCPVPPNIDLTQNVQAELICSIATDETGDEFAFELDLVGLNDTDGWDQAWTGTYSSGDIVAQANGVIHRNSWTLATGATLGLTANGIIVARLTRVAAADGTDVSDDIDVHGLRLLIEETLS